MGDKEIKQSVTTLWQKNETKTREPSREYLAKRAEKRVGQTRRIGSLSDSIARPFYAHKGFSTSRVLLEWPHIVGTALAKVCLPEKVVFPRDKTVGGSLWVRAPSSVAFQVSYQEQQILQRINQYFGYKAISFLKITQLPRLPVSSKKCIQHPPPRKPIDLGQSVGDLEQVEDEEIRMALQSLASAMMKT